MKIPKNWLKITIICLGTSSLSTLYADNMIVIYLQHAPEEVRQEVEEEFHKNRDIEKFAQFENQTPAQVSQKFLKNGIRKYLTPSLSGFVVLYGGYMDISNPDGLVTFPLRHSNPQLLVAITPEIKLIKVKGNTFSHAEYMVSDKNPVKLYQFEKKEDEKKQAYWDVSELPIPADKKVDPTTIVILSKPKNIFIADGHFIAGKGDQMVTPEIYVIGNTDKEEILLKSLGIRQYFELIEIEEKKASDMAVQFLIKNL